MTAEATVFRRQQARRDAILRELPSYGCSTTWIAGRLGRTNRSTLRDLHDLERRGLVNSDGNRSTRWWWLP